MKCVKQLFGTISVESVYLLKLYTFLKTKKQKNILKTKYLTINNKLGVILKYQNWPLEFSDVQNIQILQQILKIFLLHKGVY